MEAWGVVSGTSEARGGREVHGGRVVELDHSGKGGPRKEPVYRKIRVFHRGLVKKHIVKHATKLLYLYSQRTPDR